MKKDYAIKFQNVSKIYGLKAKDKENKRFYALKDITFEIEKGAVVGVLGTNGSGKSTLSMLLAGISEPDMGEVSVIGEQALIAINTGMNKQLTGYENIILKGALLGLNKKKMEVLIEDVIGFADLGDFIHQPVKKYSSGMKSRLGFSINMCLDTDILIVDEALSVGDKAYANKCIKKMTELKESGKTIIFISHSLMQVKSFCDKALWIEGGRFKEYGDIDTVSDNYTEFINEQSKMTKREKELANKKRFENRVVENTKLVGRKKLFGILKK